MGERRRAGRTAPPAPRRPRLRAPQLLPQRAVRPAAVRKRLLLLRRRAGVVVAAAVAGVRVRRQRQHLPPPPAPRLAVRRPQPRRRAAAAARPGERGLEGVEAHAQGVALSLQRRAARPLQPHRRPLPVLRRLRPRSLLPLPPQRRQLAVARRERAVTRRQLLLTERQRPRQLGPLRARPRGRALLGQQLGAGGFGGAAGVGGEAAGGVSLLIRTPQSLRRPGPLRRGGRLGALGGQLGGRRASGGEESVLAGGGGLGTGRLKQSGQLVSRRRGVRQLGPQRVRVRVGAAGRGVALVAGAGGRSLSRGRGRQRRVALGGDAVQAVERFAALRTRGGRACQRRQAAASLSPPPRGSPLSCGRVRACAWTISLTLSMALRCGQLAVSKAHQALRHAGATKEPCEEPRLVHLLGQLACQISNQALLRGLRRSGGAHGRRSRTFREQTSKTATLFFSSTQRVVADVLTGTMEPTRGATHGTTGSGSSGKTI